MANLAAIVANRGWSMEPHMVKDVGGNGKPTEYQVRHEVNVDPIHFEPILDAMQSVIEDRTGTGRRAYTEGFVTCGKTGTVQTQMTDHSVFMALAHETAPNCTQRICRKCGAKGPMGLPLQVGGEIPPRI